jgi:hypothetical protein
MVGKHCLQVARPCIWPGFHGAISSRQVSSLSLRGGQQKKFSTSSSSQGSKAPRPFEKLNVDDNRSGRTYQLWEREYFYYVDMHGHLHLDDFSPADQPKKTVFNLGTSYKDKRFLDFFWKRIRHNNLATGSKYLPRYEFVSPCGYAQLHHPSGMPVVVRVIRTLGACPSCLCPSVAML